VLLGRIDISTEEKGKRIVPDRRLARLI
jgi:hypothetical protein